MERLGGLNQIPDLLARRDARGLLACLRAFVFPLDSTDEEWLLAAKLIGDTVAADLSWMNAEDREAAEYFAVRQVTNALTKSWPGRYIVDGKIKEALLSFVKFLEGQNDRQVVDFAWDVLYADLTCEGRAERGPVLWMKDSGRLQGEFSFENLEHAIALAAEADAMYWWPDERWRVMRWVRDGHQFIEQMDHPSYLVRAAAAGCLGQVYRGCSQNECAEPSPAIPEIMEFLKRQEQRHAGVAGPFLMGAQWGLDWKVGREYDYRSWFLEVLRTSERERLVPHEQSLEFYAHEFFSGDAAAIEEFLEMGRKRLAVMTATESPEQIYELLPLLQKMAASEDPQVAAAIKTYLAKGYSHAGGFLDD